MDKNLDDLKAITKEILDNQLNEYRKYCPSNITDLVFLEIEKHPKYKKAYDFARNYKSEYAVNTVIGKYIREYWNLQNIGKCENPCSRLINSYTKHSN